MVVPVLITSCQVSENPKKAGNRPDNHGTESKGKLPGSTYFAGTDLRDFSK